MSHQSEQNDQASNIIRLAVMNGQITRHDFNMARRLDLFMSAETREQWRILNEAINHSAITIIENGDPVSMCSPSRQQTLTGANVSAPEPVPVPVPVPARIEPIYLQDDDVIVPSLFQALINDIEME